ncbi:MAG: hypothetical protein K2N38_03430 [Oscillospiraceae bacterium]|nr:hypothetical protein [Oscillospiraceae bacterium]
MENKHHIDYTKEILIAVKKYASLTDIQLCDKIVEIKDCGAFHEVTECMEALMMRLIDMTKKEFDSLRRYAEIMCEDGHMGYITVLNVFTIKELCDL